MIDIYLRNCLIVIKIREISEIPLINTFNEKAILISRTEGQSNIDATHYEVLLC